MSQRRLGSTGANHISRIHSRSCIRIVVQERIERVWGDKFPQPGKVSAGSGDSRMSVYVEEAWWLGLMGEGCSRRL